MKGGGPPALSDMRKTVTSGSSVKALIMRSRCSIDMLPFSTTHLTPTYSRSAHRRSASSIYTWDQTQECKRARRIGAEGRSADQLQRACVRRKWRMSSMLVNWEKTIALAPGSRAFMRASSSRTAST